VIEPDDEPTSSYTCSVTYQALMRPRATQSLRTRLRTASVASLALRSEHGCFEVMCNSISIADAEIRDQL
jgi:hypothetical protein